MDNLNLPRILVVDDMIDNIEILGSILRPDHEVIMAMNGQKALQLASGSQPDLILLDIVMPGMDGCEVCRQLKQDPATARIPVIFVSARDEEIDEVNGLSLGAVDYIVKPVSPAIVRARVKTHLSLVSAIRQLEKQNIILQDNIRLREDIERIARHDLKGPLTVFLNAQDMLQAAGSLNEAQLQILNLQTRTTRRLMEMIHHSLDLYKMEKGTYELKPVEVDIIKILNEVIRECSGLASAKNINLCLALDGMAVASTDSFVLIGEELLFSTIFSNLLKNAVEASPEDAEVMISLEKDPQAKVSITNHGQVAEQIRDRFFDRYVTYGKQRGTGLGTYSAMVMAHIMGGELFLSMDPVEKTTTLTLTMKTAGGSA
ncbi:MAG: hybrid sensor histidine kinase/response regulator [Candidatus Riflebacteria bacterium]|jgi:DNA-binding response OmpR family regulator|nr:hybrid sensor histidine kinase/response regulator [Candidatus Riflebacteria bacterium]